MARAFDGTDDSVVFTHDSGLNVAAGDLSVVCWAWIASGHAGYMVLFDKDGGVGGNRDLAVFLVGSSSSSVYIGIGDQDNEDATSVPGGIWPKDQWFHFGLTRGSNTQKVYCNGTEVLSRAQSATTTSTFDLALGYNASGGGNDLNGRLAEFAVFGRALDPAEIMSLASGFSPKCIRRSNGVLYAPLFGQSSEPDLWGGRSGAVTGATITPHPRIIYPRRKQVLVPSAAAAATTFGFLRDNAGLGVMGGGPFSRSNAGLGVLA